MCESVSYTHLDVYKRQIVYKDRMYFNALRETNTAKYGFDIELWVTDGTEAGTKLFKDINPTGSSSARNFTIVNNKLYFNATTDVEDTELWVSDGSETGTYMLKDIGQTNEYDPGAPFAYNGKAYFIVRQCDRPNQLGVHSAPYFLCRASFERRAADG